MLTVVLNHSANRAGARGAKHQHVGTSASGLEHSAETAAPHRAAAVAYLSLQSPPCVGLRPKRHSIGLRTDTETKTAVSTRAAGAGLAGKDGVAMALYIFAR
jgi:hypothetical protein